MKALLVINDVWSYVNGEEKKPELQTGEGAEASVLAINAWEREDARAKADIILSISTSELEQIIWQIEGCVTSNEVWLKLESIDKSRWPARKVTLLKQLTQNRMEDGDDVREYLQKFFNMIYKLSHMEVDIQPDLQAIMLLHSLPQSFEIFRCAILSRDELPTPEILRMKIEGESESQKWFARKQNPTHLPKNRGRKYHE